MAEPKDTAATCECGAGKMIAGWRYGHTNTCPHRPELIEAREQGRREVYAEIAKLEQVQGGGSPIYDTTCIFCGGKPFEAIPHDSTCLWLRARAAVQP